MPLPAHPAIGHEIVGQEDGVEAVQVARALVVLLELERHTAHARPLEHRVPLVARREGHAIARQVGRRAIVAELVGAVAAVVIGVFPEQRDVLGRAHLDAELRAAELLLAPVDRFEFLRHHADHDGDAVPVHIERRDLHRQPVVQEARLDAAFPIPHVLREELDRVGLRQGRGGTGRQERPGVLAVQAQLGPTRSAAAQQAVGEADLRAQLRIGRPNHGGW